MSEPSAAGSLPSAPITLEDLRHKALRIREEVVEEAKATVADRGTQIVVIGVVAVLAVISIAYLVGTRAGRRAVEPPPRR